MATVGEINGQISELRSKIAVAKMLVLYLKTNYMPADGGMAEMFVTRSDHGRVPADHIEMTSADLVEYMDGLQTSLTRLENTPIAELLKEPVVPATPTVVTSAAEPKAEPQKTEAKPAAPAAKTNGNGHVKPVAKESPSGPGDRNQNPPAPAAAPAGKS